MKIMITSVDTGYACSDLAKAHVNAIPSIIQTAYEECAHKEDGRTLVIVLLCPCCSRFSYPEKSVLISPFKGIDPNGHNVHIVDTYPPYSRSTSDMDEFCNHFRALLRKALA